MTPAFATPSLAALSLSRAPVRAAVRTTPPLVTSQPAPLAGASRSRLAARGAAPAPAAGASPKRVAVWYSSDLRVDDNEALGRAVGMARGGCLVHVWVQGKEGVGGEVRELAALLEGLGSGLLACAGRAEVELVRICKALKLDTVCFNRGIGKNAVAREKRVEKALGEAGVRVEAFWSNALVVPGAGSTELSGLLAHAKRAAKEGVRRPIRAPDSLPQMPRAALSLGVSGLVTARIGGGTSAALKLLTTMEKDRETLLRDTSPDLAILLKNHLDLGTVSPAMVTGRVVAVVGSAHGRTFSELVWRSYVCEVMQSTTASKSNAVIA